MCLPPKTTSTVIRKQITCTQMFYRLWREAKTVDSIDRTKVVHDSFPLNVQNLWQCNDLTFQNTLPLLPKAAVFQDGFVCVCDKLRVVVNKNLPQKLLLHLKSLRFQHFSGM